MLEQCSRCTLEIPKDFPEVEGRLCPSCYKKVDGTCMRCGSAPVEIVEVHRVYGLFVIGFSGKRTMVLCTRCARAVGLKNLVYTALVGWFGITPFYKSAKGQAYNLRALYKHPSLPRWTRPFLAAFAYAVPVMAIVLLSIYLLGGGGGPGGRGPFDPPPKVVLNDASRGDQALAGGKPKEAEAHFRKAIDGAPDYAPFRLGLGSALERQGRFEEAEREYRRGVRLLEGIPYREIRQSLGLLLLRTGRPGEASEILRLEVELDADPTTAPPWVQLHCTYQDALIRSNRAREALDHYLKRLEEKPGNASLLYLVGRLEARTDPGKALARFEDAERKDPRFFEPVFARGVLLLESGDPEAACETFRKALELRPNSRQVLYSLGEAQLRKRDWKAARKHFEALAELYPRSPLGPLGLGAESLWRGDAADSIPHLDAALERASTGFARAEAQLLKGLATSLDSPEEADGHFEKALAARGEPLQRARARLWQGEARARAGDREGAEKAWSGEGEGDESWAGALLRFLNGATAEAELLKRFEERPMGPKRWLALYFAGLKKWMAGDEGEARELFEKAEAEGRPLIGALVEKTGVK